MPALDPPRPVHIHSGNIHGDEIELTSPTPLPKPNPSQPPKPILTKWWSKHISPIVPSHECRDHLALERTFLAYLRTANAFALLGVATAQLFRLDPTTNPALISPFYRLGRPLGATAEAIAILILLAGAFRCWRQQGRLVSGHVKAGAGWEMYVIGLASVIYLIIMLVLNAGDGATGKAD